MKKFVLRSAIQNGETINNPPRTFFFLINGKNYDSLSSEVMLNKSIYSCVGDFVKPLISMTG